MAGTDDLRAGEPSSPPVLEFRQSRRADTVETKAGPEPRNDTIYLIEREAIELRRLRWSEHLKAAPEAKGAPEHVDLRGARGFERSETGPQPKTAEPSSLDALARYQRPGSGESQSGTGKGVIARTRTWLRQSLLGE